MRLRRGGAWACPGFASGRERGAGGGGREVVAGRGRLLHALPDGVDLGAAGLNCHQGAHAELPLEALAPEHEQGLGMVREFAGFGAAEVGGRA